MVGINIRKWDITYVKKMDIGLILMILAIIFIIFLAVWALANYYRSVQNSRTRSISGGPRGFRDPSALVWQIRSWLTSILSHEYIAVPFGLHISHDYTYSSGTDIHLVVHRDTEKQYFHDTNVILLAAIHELCHVIQYTKEDEDNQKYLNDHDQNKSGFAPQNRNLRNDRPCTATIHDADFNNLETKLVQTAVNLKYLDLEWLQTYYAKKENTYPCYPH